MTRQWLISEKFTVKAYPATQLYLVEWEGAKKLRNILFQSTIDIHILNAQKKRCLKRSVQVHRKKKMQKKHVLSEKTLATSERKNLKKWHRQVHGLNIRYHIKT